MSMLRSIGAGRQSRALRGWLLAAAVGFSMAVCAAPAEAARQITPPAWFSCGEYWNRTISIGPARVWASYRSEQVGWGIQLERWDGRRWYNYGARWEFFSTFNYFGQSATSWSTLATSRGGRYVNSKLNLPVGHSGYYRIITAIVGNQGGERWRGYIQGGAHCYMK